MTDTNKEAEKAKELIDKFLGIVRHPVRIDEQDMIDAKQCAVICCDEIQKLIPMYKGELNPDYTFWQQVKNNLTK